MLQLLYVRLELDSIIVPMEALTKEDWLIWTSLLEQPEAKVDVREDVFGSVGGAASGGG